MTQTDQQNVPKLRFPEFEGAWKQDPLSQYIGSLDAGVSVNSGDRPATGSELGILKTSAVSGGIFNREENKIVEQIEEVARLKTPVQGDTIIISRMNTPKLVGENAYVKTSNPSLFLPDRLWAAKGKAQSSMRFLSYILGGGRTRRRISDLGTGTSGSMKNIAKKDVLALEVIVPTLSEQNKIAGFLGAVDTNITQLAKKKRLLEDYKNGCMQQLFSQKIRFKDTDGNDFPDWEMKQLGEVATIVGGGTPDSGEDEYWGGEIAWFTPTEMKSKYVTDSVRRISISGLKKSSAKLLPIGTILVSTRATIGDLSISKKECCTNQGFQSLIMKDQNYNEFWYYWIVFNKKELLRRASGSTFLEINKSEISKIPVRRPHPAEQRKIADFLAALDTKIDLVAQELTHARSFKAGLLQQMFV